MAAKSLSSLFVDILKPEGFLRNGKAFFARQGDGVLVSIAEEYEPSMGFSVLGVGFLSMYGEILPQWLTPSGCLASYPAFELYDPNYYRIREPGGSGEWNIIGTPKMWKRAGFMPFPFENGVQEAEQEYLKKMDPEYQTEIFRSFVLPKIFEVDTQEKLCNVIDRVSPFPNNSFKIFPLLACGRYADAQNVVSAIIEQNRSALLRKGYSQAEAQLDPCVKKYLALEQMIAEEKYIDLLLKENFEQNTELFEQQFCKKEER